MAALSLYAPNSPNDTNYTDLPFAQSPAYHSGRKLKCTDRTTNPPLSAFQRRQAQVSLPGGL